LLVFSTFTDAFASLHYHNHINVSLPVSACLGDTNTFFWISKRQLRYAEAMVDVGLADVIREILKHTVGRILAPSGTHHTFYHLQIWWLLKQDIYSGLQSTFEREGTGFENPMYR
jgi:hypothetical protein